MGNNRADLRIAPDLVRAARRIGATCIDSYNMQSQHWATLAAGLMPSLRRIIPFHSAYPEYYQRAPKLQLYEVTPRLGRQIGSEFIAVSETFAANLARMGIPQQLSTVGENGIKPLPSEPASASLFETIGLSGRGAELLVKAIVGRLSKVKGHSF